MGGVGTEPHDYAGGVRVDGAHELDLGAAFGDVGLVDAELVYPQDAGFGAAEAVEDIMEVFGDGDVLFVEEDVVGQSGWTPHVGEGFVEWA